MAIGASDRAFCYLSFDAGPSRSAINKDRDIELFVAKMIEFENDHVVHLAVDTWMSSEVFEDLPAILFASRVGVLQQAGPLRILVLLVVADPIRGEARSAP
jgi:hypothetical protein